MIGRWLCKHGRHFWTRASILQLRSERIVARECARCGVMKTAVQDVWSDPTRARVTTRRGDAA